MIDPVIAHGTDCREAIRRRKSFVMGMCVAIPLLPAATFLAASVLENDEFPVAAMLVLIAGFIIARFSWLDRCPACGSFLTMSVKEGLFVEKSPVIHDCGAVLQ